MSHLDNKVTQLSLFETRVSGASDDTAKESQIAGPMPMPVERERSLAVGPVMVPEQMRETLMNNYGVNDSMFVNNLPARTKGHHY